MIGKRDDNKILIDEIEYEIIAYISIDRGNFLVYTDSKEITAGQFGLYVNRVLEENEQIILDEVEDGEVMQVIAALKERMIVNDK